MPLALLRSRSLLTAGTTLFQKALDGLDDAALAHPTDLPGWTRAHVVAHAAANAESLVNLATWARTGVETPMCASAEQRDAEIEAGAQLSPLGLRDWFTTSATALDTALGSLTSEQWTSLVRTAQRRTVPASEVPWMRTREVMVHAVDLDGGVEFDDLPAEFLVELLYDATAKRTATGTGPALVLITTDGAGPGDAWSVPGSGAVTRVRGPSPSSRPTRPAVVTGTSWLTPEQSRPCPAGSDDRTSSPPPPATRQATRHDGQQPSSSPTSLMRGAPEGSAWRRPRGGTSE
ncbi:maleylpyruvate isomerase family mycothiol-dependent enzyme [Monashia sp. NPDC004114]